MKLFPRARLVDLIAPEVDAQRTDDLWVLTPGSCQIATFEWLKSVGKHRPPIVFFLNGEAAKACFHLWRYRTLIQPSDVLSVSCSSEKSLIDSWFPGNNQTVVTYYPIDQKNFQTQSTRPRSRFELPLNKTLMLYSGRLSLQKNILSLIELLAFDQDLHLVLAGDFDQIGTPHLAASPPYHLPTQVTTLIKKRGFSSRISFFPYQSQESLAALMNACDYQISLSSHYGEDFGYSIAQGLGCGLKTILSKWGGHLNWSNGGAVPISYVELNWKNLAVGVPQIDANVFENRWLPKSAAGKDFRWALSKEIATSIEMSAEKALSQLHPSSSDGMSGSHELAEYWFRIENGKQRFMYLDRHDSVFQKVIEHYQNLVS